jgi:hypothetical protein
VALLLGLAACAGDPGSGSITDDSRTRPDAGDTGTTDTFTPPTGQTRLELVSSQDVYMPFAGTAELTVRYVDFNDQPIADATLNFDIDEAFAADTRLRTQTTRTDAEGIASVGIVAGAKNAENAKKFVNYTMSAEGQELLFDAAISRLPVLPSAYKKAPPGFPNPFTGTIKPKVNFDADLAESRYYVVSSIFDQTITFKHKDLIAAAKAINEAAAKLAGKNNAQAQRLLDDARDLAYTPVVSEEKSKDKEFLALYRNTKRDAEKTKQTTALEEYWSNTARKNYARAVELAQQAAALAK